MTRKLRWGIISTANIAKKLCHAIKGSETGILSAVASRTLEKAQAFATEQDVPKAYGSYEELLDDSDIDIVYNPLPNHMHAEWSIKAARAGKHILHEKPFATNVAQAMRVIEEARRHDVFLMEAFMFRAHPQTFKFLEIIASGVIGEVKVIQADFGFSMGEDPDNIRQQNHSAGGGITDVGCYTLNGARLIAGAAQGTFPVEPIDIQSIAHIGPESRVDEYAIAVLRFENDIVANLTCSIKASIGSRLVICGSKGNIEIPRPWLMDENAKFILKVNGEEDREITVKTHKPPYSFEVDACADLLEHRNPPAPYMSWEDSIAQQEALDRWRAAIGLVFDEEKEETGLQRTVTGLPLTRFADAPMTYGRVDGIDKDISHLVMGTMIYRPERQPFTNAMLDYFFELGGNAFDTAHGYGGGRSETAIGNWIRQRNVRDQVCLITKGGATIEVTPEIIEGQLEISLDRLQTDYADLFLMHRDNPTVPVGEFVDCLNRLKDANHIHAFGGSNWTIERLQAALDYARANGKTPFAASSPNFSLAVWNQPVWNDCTRANDPESRQWHTVHQFPLFAWSSQARGFFSGRYDPENTADSLMVDSWYNKANWERLHRAEELARKKGVSAIAIAAAYVLMQPFPIFALIGPATMQEIRTSCESLHINLTQEELAWLNLES